MYTYRLKQGPSFIFEVGEGEEGEATKNFIHFPIYY